MQALKFPHPLTVKNSSAAKQTWRRDPQKQIETNRLSQPLT